jgi:hypothetical protein
MVVGEACCHSCRETLQGAATLPALASSGPGGSERGGADELEPTSWSRPASDLALPSLLLAILPAHDLLIVAR